MTAGTPIARRCSRNRRSWASSRRTPSSRGHDPDVQDWEKLSADERKLYARMMEVFAGFLTHADHYIGELIQFLKDLGEYENTLIMVISDNGASAEGGPPAPSTRTSFSTTCRTSGTEPGRHRRHRRTEVLSTTTVGLDPRRQHPVPPLEARDLPRRRSDPFLVCWPKGIKANGEIRTQYAHAIDMVPTVLDALGIEPPTTIRGVTQSPIEGHSLAHTFDDAKAPTSTSPNTSRCSATGRFTTTAGARSARGPAPRSPNRDESSAPRSRTRS